MKNRSVKQRKKHISYMKKYNKKYYNKDKKLRIDYVKEYQWRVKQIGLFICSNGTMKCKKCSCDNIDCLDLDHLNNDGHTLRKSNPNYAKNQYFYLQKYGYPVDYQVLCRNCNWIKYLEHKDKKLKEEKL